MPALNNLATAYQQEKNPLALEYAEKAYKLAPDSPAVLDTLGWILVGPRRYYTRFAVFGKSTLTRAGCAGHSLSSCGGTG